MSRVRSYYAEETHAHALALSTDLHVNPPRAHRPVAQRLVEALVLLRGRLLRRLELARLPLLLEVHSAHRDGLGLS